MHNAPVSVVLFAGGGTGGHLTPALAIAEAMVQAAPGVEPYFVGAVRGVEARVLPSRPYRYTLLPLEPIYRRQWWKNAGLPFALWRSLSGIGEVLRRERPVLVVGTGGYVCGPVVWAAMGRGIPGVIQEANAYPGFATRRLAGRVRQLHLGFPEARQFLAPGPATEVFDSGNPIQPPPARPGKTADGRWQTSQAKVDLGLDPDRPLVLVVGGSQGSVAINEAVAAALSTGAWPRDAQLLWQTGSGSFDRFRHLSSDACHQAAYFDPIAPAFAAADLVVSRAGAMSLAELAAWGLPSILVPLPTAAADHQLTNARAMAGAGAAVVLEQPQLTGASLADKVSGLLADPARLADLSRAALARSRPRAAREIAHEALRLVSNP
jgi:UDP-N-acetylglucosamine--N-acetylmuramyl-(pentapeptide) pyrophosphoryl-undecaprenol N-acetylglucosamine transferase